MHTKVRKGSAASIFRVEYGVALIVCKGGINIFARLNDIKTQQPIIVTPIPVKTSNFTTKYVSNIKNRGFHLGVKNQNTISNGRFQ